jgi:hypothetical protein
MLTDLNRFLLLFIKYHITGYNLKIISTLRISRGVLLFRNNLSD